VGGEHMGVVLELYVLAVDATGIYVINDGGRAWTSGRIDADASVFAEVKLLALEYEPGLALPIIHGTSNRQDGPRMVHTFVAVADTGPYAQFVLDRWPQALPVTPEGAVEVGPAIPHESNDRPFPRDCDVLLHAVGHLRNLCDTNRKARMDMSLHLRRHLGEFEPVLNRMYDNPLADEA
jgi:hypothetical protein